jgi:hypothetical protein
MKRSTELTVIVFIYFSFFTAFALHAWWDFTHPKVWDSPDKDPYVYVWFLVGGWAVCGYVFTRIILNERNLLRRARLSQLVKRAELLLSQNKLVEAEACLNECRKLAGLH